MLYIYLIISITEVMQALPLVSIVTCSYNNADFILDTLDSIKAQTYAQIELVIVDDCSTDNSVALIEEWLKDYAGKYTFIKHEVNKGGAETYNVGIRNATGKYYAPVDSDDVLLPEKTERQVALLEAAGANVAAVYSDAYVMDVNGVAIEGLFTKRHRQFDVMPTGNIYDTLLQGNFIPLLSLLIRREVFDELGGYDDSLVYGDYDMWLRIARKYEFIYSDYISAKYRIRPGSLTHVIRNWDESNARIFLKHADAALPLEWLNKIATHSYSTYNDPTMPHIKQLAKRTADRCLMTTYLLWVFRVAPEFGAQVQVCVTQHIEKGLSPNMLQLDDTEVNVFLQEVAYSVPLALFRKMALDAYCRERGETMILINALADKLCDRYLKAACLLAKYKVEKEKGMALLASLGPPGVEEPFAGPVPLESELSVLLQDVLPLVSTWWLQKIAGDEYENGNEQSILLLNGLANKTSDRFLKTVYLLWKFRIAPAVGKLVLKDLQDRISGGLTETINDPAAPDTKVFVNEIAPHIPLGLMKKIVSEDYRSDNKQTRSFVSEFAQDSGDTYLIAACLLWKFKIPAEAGSAILQKIDEALKSGAAVIVDVVKTTDILSFFKELMHILSVDLLKEVACSAYFQNDRTLLPLVKYFGRATKSRYFKAVRLLWKYNVNEYTGRIILARVDEYIKAKRSNLYIDLCVYKDIYGAYKTKNNTLDQRNNVVAPGG